MRSSPWQEPHVEIIVTPVEVGEIAELVVNDGGGLPENFQPAEWLEANRADLGILITEAVKDILFDALEGGLIDHPLLLHRRMENNGKNRD